LSVSSCHSFLMEAKRKQRLVSGIHATTIREKHLGLTPNDECVQWSVLRGCCAKLTRTLLLKQLGTRKRRSCDDERNCYCWRCDVAFCGNSMAFTRPTNSATSICFLRLDHTKRELRRKDRRTDDRTLVDTECHNAIFLEPVDGDRTSLE